jgi:NADPH-dependent 2,4-dienoyl-CoA reductase/sulfur reductase-like enzyme/Fe-S-cluster-containing hydrogenase component 2/bacterioferritin-associated ferredoxin
MTTKFRITQHPILPIPDSTEISFQWKGQDLQAHSGETIAAALYANGIHVFGHHPRDGAPQGIFCANGQCAQCLVLANGRPVKSCMESIRPGMRIEPSDGLPVLPELSPNETAAVKNPSPIQEMDVPVLIIGGGPAGLSAGIELGKLGIEAILVDDKHRLGGKLVLQTHRFFGSSSAVYAGTRGIDIATRLEKEIRKYPSIDIWLESTVLAVFSDQKVGIQKAGNEYVLVKPQILLVATGAREKFLAFRGNTLPGVYGAGAFQTLVNRDLVRPAEKLFIVGGGNVGLIAGYHALQANIAVVGLAEALPECGGYKVHRDKLARMGVPIYTSHTILSANGNQQVESVTIAQVDDHFQAIPGTEKSFTCDSVLIAVGLDPVDEFYQKARDYQIPVFAAGDAEEIAEASAAMFSGKIRGLEIARKIGAYTNAIPRDWYRTMEILKSKPGQKCDESLPEYNAGVIPVIHCTQEIPCNPCSTLCPNGLISVDETDIRKTPVFLGNNFCCQVCERCVAGCPGLAITLVDYHDNPEQPVVSIPFEFSPDRIWDQEHVTVLDVEGKAIATLKVIGTHRIPSSDRTLIVQVMAPKELACKIAGVRIQDTAVTLPLDTVIDHVADDTIICRCERVTAGEIRALIRKGFRDLNEIKTVSRAGMGACGSKTCRAMVHRLFREEGIPISEMIDNTRRPLFIETSLGCFAGVDKDPAHE